MTGSVDASIARIPALESRGISVVGLALWWLAIHSKLIGITFASQSYVKPLLGCAVLAQCFCEGAFQRIIATSGFVMGTEKHLDSSLLGEFNARGEGAMPPAFFGRVFLCGVRGVCDQHIYAANGLDDCTVLFVHKALIGRVAFILRVVDVVGGFVVTGKEFQNKISLDKNSGI